MDPILCRPDSPQACAGRRFDGTRGPGVWCDPETLVWYWSPQLKGEQTGVWVVTECPHCGGTLPLRGTARETRTWLDSLADPEE